VLKALVALLLLANLAFFAWTEGWLDGVVGVRAIGDREPERLARQVRPETIRILPFAAAGSAPSTTERACLEAGPFVDAEWVAAQTAAQNALPAGSWTVRNVEQAGAYLVYMGKFTDREALAKKVDEIKRRQLPYEEIVDDPALAPGLSLGRFDAKVAATQALERFTQLGVRTARVVEIAAPASRHSIRIEQADPALTARLLAMPAGLLGKSFAACSAPSPGT
jgi:hypothetical protein